MEIVVYLLFSPNSLGGYSIYDTNPNVCLDALHSGGFYKLHLPLYQHGCLSSLHPPTHSEVSRVSPLSPLRTRRTLALPFRQCDELGGGHCGIYEERSNGGVGKTGSLKPGVCGTSVGWLGPHTACGAVRDELISFPDEFPYDCHRAARHGTYKQV